MTMRNGSWLVVSMLALAGCVASSKATSGAPVAPAPEALAANSAVAPPLTAPSSEACGGFEQRALAPKVALLGDRLFITPLAGTESTSPPSDTTSPGAVDEPVTRLSMQEGEHQLLVYSEELFARASATLVANMQHASASVSLRDLPGEERRLASGLRAALFVQPKLVAHGGTVPLAHAITVLPDETLQATHVFVTPSVVEAGSGGCRALALKLLESLGPGSRRMDLSGGRRALTAGYTLDVPVGASLTAQPGPDFTVFQLAPILPPGQAAGRLGLYFGQHPDFEQDPAAQQLRAKILGRDVTWLRTQEGEEIGQEALVQEPRGLAIHLFLAAPNAAAADELARVAASLKRGNPAAEP